MSDGVLRVPPDSTGKRLDTEELVVSALTVQRERMQIAGAVDVEIARILNTDPAAADYALVTRGAALVSPQTSFATVATVAAGGTGSVDSTQLNAAVTGKLLGFEASGSVPFGVELQTVVDAITTSRMMFFDQTKISWRTPHKDLISQAHSVGAGFDGFRLLFTNLDTGVGSADFFGSFFWDEV